MNTETLAHPKFKSRKHWILTALCFALATVTVQPTLGDESDEIIFEGMVFRTFAFPDFLDPAFTNTTTRAWNLGSETTAHDHTFRGLEVDGADDGGFEGLTIVNDPSAFSGSALNYGAGPDELVKNNLATTGLQISNSHGSPEWSLNIAATPGQKYTVEVLQNPAFTGAQSARNVDVTVDGVLFADNLFTPALGVFSSVYRFDVTADSDGIDILFSRGTNSSFSTDAGTRPLIMALAVTEELLDITSPAVASVPEGTTLVHSLTADDPTSTFTVLGYPTGPGLFNFVRQLGENDTVNSENGLNSMVMQSDGNLVVYQNGTAIWATGTDGNPGAFAKINEFSNFRVAINPAGSSQVFTLWESGTTTFDGFQGVYGKVENNGQVVLLRPDGQRLWESTLGNTGGGGTAFSLPTLDPFYDIGADNFYFEVVNGELHFRNSPDYENPFDFGGDNSYEVSVLAEDENGRQAVQLIQVLVTDENEFLLGDVNLDGAVNLLDVDPFIALIGSGTFQAEADINGDGVVNLLDVDPLVALLGS